MDKIYLEALQALAETANEVPPICDSTSPHSAFGEGGPGTLERQNWTGRTTEIGTRLLTNTTRSIWLDQAIGMALWNLRASNALPEVAFYNPNALRFSDDGETIRAPWGRRLLLNGEQSDLAAIVRLLRRDPSSLRAVVPVFRESDLAVSSRDVPCMLGLQFLVRESGLEMICFLRSLNPYWVWPYDHFFLSILLEFSARLLGKEPGAITYMAASLQISRTDLPLVDKALSCGVQEPIEAPSVPEYYKWGHLVELDRVEQRIRNALADARLEPLPEQRWHDAFAQADWWMTDLMAALVYAFLMRHCDYQIDLPFDCPIWARRWLAQQYPDKIEV